MIRNTKLESMVFTQLKRRGVSEKVCGAFLKVDRIFFVPENQKDYAYDDSALPIAEGQTISQPYMAALMIENADISQNDTVLEVGAGSGYAAGLCAVLSRKVYALERISLLAFQAKKNLDSAGINKKVIIINADGTELNFLKIKFDKIIVSAAAPFVPENYFLKLKENGKLIIPVGDTAFAQTLKIYTKSKAGISEKSAGGCVFVPLIGKYGHKKRRI